MIDHSEVAKRFWDQGYLVIEDFFPAEKLEEIERALQRYIERLAAEGSLGYVVYELGPELKVRNLFEMEKYDEYFSELARAPQFMELFAAIFDDPPILMAVELFAKPARVGSEVPHHQDNAYFTLDPEDALTCWVALRDATETNGCMRYIHGSHKLGNLPHVASGVKGNSMRLETIPLGTGPEVCGVVRRGGALIHHCNTIHRSEPNRSDLDRPGLLFVYKASRCRVNRALAQNYESVVSAM